MAAFPVPVQALCFCTRNALKPPSSSIDKIAQGSGTSTRRQMSSFFNLCHVVEASHPHSPLPPNNSSQVDVEIQEMCSKHATGKPVTITRGGNRARLRAVMPNGGVTLVTYDTRVTSRVCGRVIYAHSDNTEVLLDVPLVLHMEDTPVVSHVPRLSQDTICTFKTIYPVQVRLYCRLELAARYPSVDCISFLRTSVNLCRIHRTRFPPSPTADLRLPPFSLSVLHPPTASVLQVVANDKGEVVVRPRGLWEGTPVHGVLAGPNSSMPPNCAQPDLLVGAYTFDCLKASIGNVAAPCVYKRGCDQHGRLRAEFFFVCVAKQTVPAHPLR